MKLILKIAALFAAVQMFAATQVQIFHLPMTSGDWRKTFNVASFDTNLGTLTQVDVIMSFAQLDQIAIESLDAAPKTYSCSLASQLTLYRPNCSVMVQTNVVLLKIINLAKYDGLLDFNGPSGNRFIFQKQYRLPFTTFVGSDLALFASNAFVPLDFGVVDNSTQKGGGNVAFSDEIKSSCSVTVIYSYTPRFVVLPPKCR